MFLFKIYDVQIGIDKLKDKSKFLEVNMILETERLYLREMNQSDFESLCKILQDEDTMYAYEGAFNVDEVQEWLDRQIFRYQEWNFGLWAVILKETNQMIGQCGLTMQPWKDENVLEIGYLFERTYWHKGYAIEAAKACKKYAFEILKADEVCSIIRDTNIASQKVAIRNGMTIKDVWTKHYRGVDMPHYRYVVHH
jgi:ribosomal-protein-alanine N-acetyltransferase